MFPRAAVRPVKRIFYLWNLVKLKHEKLSLKQKVKCEFPFFTAALTLTLSSVRVSVWVPHHDSAGSDGLTDVSADVSADVCDDFDSLIRNVFHTIHQKLLKHRKHLKHSVFSCLVQVIWCKMHNSVEVESKVKTDGFLMTLTFTLHWVSCC